MRESCSLANGETQDEGGQELAFKWGVLNNPPEKWM